ncbi:TonB-dependent receptor [bacterium]|nr:TonB-dependent receptor [bacterium]
MKSGLIIALFLLMPAILFAQHPVSGTVRDSVGEPLVGVNIVQKGTYRGATTNIRGEFKIAATSPMATLVFSYIGYSKIEVPVNGQSEIDVVMKENVIELNAIQIVGTRSFNRTVTETPVAVDVIQVKDVTEHSGQVSVNQLLQYAAPSFNSNKQSGADGADHIDPATLRGLGPDQTLVLINGKRRHQSSLINIFGSRGRGNTGTDLDAIPAAAIERIEILRDGASAQYGSDAIAGVINIVLKSSVNEFTGSVTTGISNADPGSNYDINPDKSFDGLTVNTSANYGVRLGQDGFANFTLDYVSKAKTNRPTDPDAFDVYREKFGDASANNFAVYMNSAIPINAASGFYIFAGYNHRYTDAYAWTRGADEDRNIPEIYPNGFNPRITSTITDYSVSAGYRSKFNGWDIDLNNTFGSNRFDYVIKHTLNASLLAASPTKFDAGGFQLIQNTSEANFSKFYSHIAQGANFAFGATYRIDNYQIFAGEEGSWKNYGGLYIVGTDTSLRPAGSQGFPGFQPSNELNKSRTNIGAYADAEFDLTQEFMIGTAARFEHYSDFGNTFNGKLASRYKVTPDVSLRGSVSTGFRAPSLAQVYFNSSFTDFVGGEPVEKLIARNDAEITKALGIPALKQEKAIDMSLGFTAKYEDFTATVDAYRVVIKDRIVLTGAFDNSDTTISAYFPAGIAQASFFTNAIDTKTNGLDIVLGWTRYMDNSRLNVTYAANFTDMSLGKTIKTSDKLAGKEDIYFGRREQLFLLASAPDSKMNLTFDYKMNAFTTNLQFIRFGEVKLENWDGNIDKYRAKIVTNLAFGYNVSKNITVSVGANNVFNQYPDQHDAGLTETGGNWDAVQMGFSGAYYFSKITFTY